MDLKFDREAVEAIAEKDPEEKDRGERASFDYGRDYDGSDVYDSIRQQYQKLYHYARSCGRYRRTSDNKKVREKGPVDGPFFRQEREWKKQNRESPRWRCGE